MNINIRKIQLAQNVLSLEDEKIISLLENLLKERRIKDYEAQLTPMSISEFKNQIKQAELDFESGRFTEAEALLEKYR